MKKYIPILLIIATFLVGLFSFPYLPAKMATHWGISGQADGFSPKGFGTFFVPVLMIAMYFLFLFLPSTDPYKKNFNQFRKYYNSFIVLIFSFFLYTYSVTIAWNLGYRFDMVQVLCPGFAAIFYYAGVLTSVAKRNWFVGIRTPWTMSNDTVWDKTHYLGGKLFKAVGILSLAGIFFPGSAALLIFFPAIFVSIFVFAYSYYLYQKETKTNL